MSWADNVDILDSKVQGDRQSPSKGAAASEGEALEVSSGKPSSLQACSGGRSGGRAAWDSWSEHFTTKGKTTHEAIHT